MTVTTRITFLADPLCESAIADIQSLCARAHPHHEVMTVSEAIRFALRYTAAALRDTPTAAVSEEE